MTTQKSYRKGKNGAQKSVKQNGHTTSNGNGHANGAETPRTIGRLDEDRLLNLLQDAEDYLAEARDYIIDSAGEQTDEYIRVGLSKVRGAMLVLDEIRDAAIKAPKNESAVPS